MQTPPTHDMEMEVRFSDIDAYGHVNNATYFTYLETARTRLFLEKFIEFADDGLLFLVAKAECEYRKPINLADRVIVSMHIERIGNSSFDIAYRLHDNNGTTYADAQTVMVCYDRKENRAATVPAELKSALC